jgi:hypothetical protein
MSKKNYLFLQYPASAMKAHPISKEFLNNEDVGIRIKNNYIVYIKGLNPENKLAISSTWPTGM